MDDSVRQLFSEARVVFSREDFYIISLPGVADVQIGGEGFSAVIKEKGETTLVITREYWHALEPKVKGAKVEGPFRAIHFDLPSQRGTPGFIEEALRALAKEKIGAGIVSAFSRDHLLVRSGQMSKSIRALETLILECRKEKGEGGGAASVEEGAQPAQGGGAQ
jgi:hypothetical protein